jgi:molybdenum cofactor cytidylyltransferase
VNIAAIILAAGKSSRFEIGHKLLAKLNGVTLIRHVAAVLDHSRLSEIILVTGTNSKDVIAAAGAGRWRSIENPNPGDGLASSLRLGIQNIDAAADGVLIALADMPGISTGLIATLLDAFDESRGRSIVFPVGTGGQRGHPVIWPKSCFCDLSKLSGDTGGKALIEKQKDLWRPVPYEESGAFADIDTCHDLAVFPRTPKV